MKFVTLELPDDLSIDENETRRFLAAKMYEAGKLSLGQASKVAGLSKMAFSEILSDYNISLINHSEDDILSDAAKF